MPVRIDKFNVEAFIRLQQVLTLSAAAPLIPFNEARLQKGVSMQAHVIAHIPYSDRLLDLHTTPPTPVPILQRQWEFDVLMDLYTRLGPRYVLEIGTYHGGTLYHWLRLAVPNATVVSVETYQTGVDNRHMYSSWTPDGIALHAIVGNSHDLATVETVRTLLPTIDFLFIDALHLYDAVLRDWTLYGPLVRRGGIVAVADHGNLPVQRRC